jgi:hypothetical protein
MITLADGAILRTIGDAAALIQERFRMTDSWAALEATLILLHRAAASGDPSELQNATDALLRTLHHSRMLGRLDEGKTEPP